MQVPARRRGASSAGSIARSSQRIATPQGSCPTAISATFALVAVSTTATALDRPQATYNFVPSGVIAIFQGRLPTGIVATIALVDVSITCTVPSPPEVTYTLLPSGLTTTPFERTPALIRASTWRFSV